MNLNYKQLLCQKNSAKKFPMEIKINNLHLRKSTKPLLNQKNVIIRSQNITIENLQSLNKSISMNGKERTIGTKYFIFQIQRNNEVMTIVIYANNMFIIRVYLTVRLLITDI